MDDAMMDGFGFGLVGAICTARWAFWFGLSGFGLACWVRDEPLF